MTVVMSMLKVTVRSQRSRSQRSKPNLAFSGMLLKFEFTYGEEMMRNAWYGLEEQSCPIVFHGHLSNFKITPLIKSSILTQIRLFRTVTPV